MHSATEARPKIRYPVMVIIALVMTGLLMLAAVGALFLTNPATGVFQFVVLLAAFFGLLRRTAWAGLGLALFLAGGALSVLIESWLLGTSRTVGPAIWISLFITLAMAAIALLAGIALLRVGVAGRAWPWLVVTALPIVVALFFSPMIIPTAAMEPTLLAGDQVLVRRSGAAGLSRGDLIVYRGAQQTIFVKRVAAVGGDRLHFHLKTLYVNGAAQSERYTRHAITEVNPYRDEFPNGPRSVPVSLAMQDQLAKQVINGEFLVPAGTYFVVGDNRDLSFDSRYSGVVNSKDVIGRPVLIYFSAYIPPDAAVGQPVMRNLLTHARWNRVLQRP